MVPSETSSVNAPGMKIHFGNDIFMVDNKRQSNITHHVSCRDHRVSHSVMSTEVIAFFNTLDNGAYHSESTHRNAVLQY